MFERLSEDDISNALAELISWFGVKEEVPIHGFTSLLREKNIGGCVQEIATKLNLPINIILSYVPEGFRPNDTDGFCSSSLSRTDWTGHGIESITAQVSIPQNLPMFGTSALNGFQIQVRVSENCNEYPETFVALMAHELSHVLLASLHHPQEDSELHTDLVPIILGFGNIIVTGRKIVQSTTSGNTTTTHTTTYGYLTDSQFDFACKYVTNILRRHQCDKKSLITLVKRAKHKLKKTSRSLRSFRDYFKYLDRYPPEKMSKNHAQRVVQLHFHDYASEWENRIKVIREAVEGAASFVRSLSHYTNNTVENVKNKIREIGLVSDEIDLVNEEISKDNRILRRYVGFIYKLRRILWYYS